MMNLPRMLSKKAKLFLYRNTGIVPGPHYPYMLEPRQLALLVNELERLHDVDGNIAEIGVFRGMTTRFMCEYINERRQGDPRFFDSLTYFAIDTFESFRSDDMRYEVSHRGKAPSEVEGFNINDFEVWKKHFAPFPYVTAIKADCAAVDYRTIAPLKLALLDVDLYLPTSKTLPRLYEALVPGGAIVVDDVKDKHQWDGAYQAYMEFCRELGVAPEIVGSKCGVIRK